MCKSAPRPRQTPCQHPTTQFFYRPDALPATKPQRQSTSYIFSKMESFRMWVLGLETSWGQLTVSLALVLALEVKSLVFSLEAKSSSLHIIQRKWSLALTMHRAKLELLEVICVDGIKFIFLAYYTFNVYYCTLRLHFKNLILCESTSMLTLKIKVTGIWWPLLTIMQ